MAFHSSRRLVICSLMSTALAATAFGDEGMWLFNNPPLQQFKEKYQFEPTPQWLDHLQKSSVRFNSGGSGSFVSADGLVITNHHVGLDTLQKISSEKNNYVRDGFYAKSRAEEPKATDLELNVLMSIEDVTERVNAGVQPGLSGEEASKARGNVIAQIEKESKDKTGLRSDVVTLYQGGVYNLYRYKRYDDVRLVFAPEEQIAFYGGDPDNFEYPRFDLDICIFRAYENGQPAKIEHFLKWNTTGPADGELTFVSGHPGRTDRQLTVSELAEARDVEVPYLLSMYNRREVLLGAFGARSFENARRVQQDRRGVENNRKRYDGYLAALLDPEVWSAIDQREQRLRDAMNSKPEFKGMIAAYDRIKQAQADTAKVLPVYHYFETNRGRAGATYRAPRAFYSNLFKYARRLLRAGEERAKPNGERFPEYRDSNRESLELDFFSTEPVHPDVEQVTLADSLTDMATAFGFEDPLVRQVLAGKSPADRAAELVTGTKLGDPAFRRQLYSGDPPAIASANDPMLELARLVDAPARAARKTFEAQDETKQQAYAEIAKARFAIEGTSSYPDATFTLRLSYGPVLGYEENGKQIAPLTTFAGLYQRAAEHNNQPPFDLPKRWIERKGKLNMSTPFNFVSTADIIGGNSGSPVTNKANEFVGIIFDGNIQSLVLDCIYAEKQARAVSVDSAAISEALRKIYDAGALADEIEGKTAQR
ncbi:MAG: S46 family peptidase [Chthoniobacterales bacterium]|nr:S46 family peptidase [Chthoniobacterales bacterium]